MYEASVGRSMREVATLLGRPVEWVREHLLRNQVEDATGGDVRRADTSSHKLLATRDEVREVMKRFAPAKPNEDYVAEYEAEGHTPEVAQRQWSTRCRNGSGRTDRGEKTPQTAPEVQSHRGGYRDAKSGL